MKAWQLNTPGEPLELIERPDPVAGPGEVVVDVRAAGMCHTDCGLLDGIIPPTRTPLILGHETAGVVSQIGRDVSGVALGDRVLISGPPEFAAGWTADGGYADKCLAKAVGLVKLPDTVSFIQGAMATDAGATSYGGVMLAGGLRAGQKVAIIGLGGLGTTGARLAVLNGAEVYAAEPRREVWPDALERGVTEVVEDITELADLGLDLIVDFAGFGTTTAGAIVAVRPGGTVVQVGLGRSESTISTLLLTSKAVTLRGFVGGDPAALSPVLDHMATGELVIPATPITFDEIPAGLDRLNAGGVVGRLVAVMGD